MGQPVWLSSGSYPFHREGAEPTLAHKQRLRHQVSLQASNFLGVWPRTKARGQRTVVLFRKPGYALLELNAETVQGHRQQLVSAYGEDGVHELVRCVAFSEGFPCRVADKSVKNEFVGRPKQGPVEGRPARGSRP